MYDVIVCKTYSEIENKIGYANDSGFTLVVNKLKKIFEESKNVGIDVSELEDIIWVFEHFQDIFDTKEAGTFRFIDYENIIILNDPNDEMEFVKRMSSTQIVSTFEEGWIVLLRNLNIAIDEFVRYKYPENSFLIYILRFLSTLYIIRRY